MRTTMTQTTTTARAQTPTTIDQTGAAATAAPPPATRVFPPPPGARSVRFGLRARIILVHVGLLAFAILASVLVARQALLVRLDERIDAELGQEVSELRKLARGSDPTTGERFGENVQRLFQVFLQRNIPSRHEVVITFVDGKSFLRSPLRAEPYRLDEDQELVALWGRLEEVDRGEVSTPGGRVKYLAVPIIRSDRRPAGVFVVANFRDREEDELDGAIFALSGVGLALLLIGSILAWRLAGSVLGPVRAVTSTARSITETSLERRIPQQGSDEIAQLAATFNDMLDRLERAFTMQRRFLDDAGHELRTPITIVRGNLEFADEGERTREPRMASRGPRPRHHRRGPATVDPGDDRARAERRPAHAGWRRDRARLGRVAGRRGASLGPRQWPGYSGGGPGADLRALRPRPRGPPLA